LLLALALLLGRLGAQVANSPGPDSQSSDPRTIWEADPTSLPGTGGGAPPAGIDIFPDVIMTLDIPGIIELSRLAGTGVVVGAAGSQGYGWDHTPQGDTSGSVAVFQPYAGFYHAGRRDKFIFEYHPTIDLFTGDKWDGSVLHRAGFNIGYLISPRWTWYVSGRSTYGPAVLEDIGVLTVGLNSFALPTDTVFISSGTTGFTWRSAKRQTLSFIAGNSYSAIKHGPHFDDSSTRVQFAQGFARDSNAYVYTQANRYSNLPGCTRVGFGGGVSFGVSANTRFGVQGGPEYSVGNCVAPVTSTFGGFIHQRFTKWTALTVSASRELTEPALLQSRWVDRLSAILQQRITRTTHLTLGSSYIRSSDLPGTTLPRYRGFLFSSQFHWHVASTVDFITSYQYFKREAATTGFPDRHAWVFFTLVWHPGIHGQAE